MQNEERINGLETQVRIFKRIVCLAGCLALIAQLLSCNTEVEADETDNQYMLQKSTWEYGRMETIYKIDTQKKSIRSVSTSSQTEILSAYSVGEFDSKTVTITFEKNDQTPLLISDFRDDWNIDIETNLHVTFSKTNLSTSKTNTVMEYYKNEFIESIGNSGWEVFQVDSNLKPESDVEIETFHLRRRTNS